MPAGDEPVIGVSIDSREDVSGKLFIAIRGERHDGHEFVPMAAARGSAIVMVEREIDLAAVGPRAGVLVVPDARRALLALAAWYRGSFTNCAVVAVTGSCGKTTTRRLIHAALSSTLDGTQSPKSFNNDIGVPLTLLAVKPSHRFVVVEVGINAVGEMQPLAEVVRPDVAVMTNVGPSHLEGLLDVDTVANEKLRLAHAVAPGGIAILHADSESLASADNLPASATWFGESAKATVRLQSRRVQGGRQVIWLFDGASFEIALAGRHNAVNALAAIAVARRLGLSDDAIARGLADAAPPPMRMQEERSGEIRIVNDAYNANPQSMIAGVETFLESLQPHERCVLVLGDMCELGASGPGLHENVGREIGRRIADFEHVIVHCVGELASDHLAATLRQSAPHAQVHCHAAMSERAADLVAATLRPGDAALLKGSRAMALEALIPAVHQRHAHRRAGAAVAEAVHE